MMYSIHFNKIAKLGRVLKGNYGILDFERIMINFGAVCTEGIYLAGIDSWLSERYQLKQYYVNDWG